MPANGKADGRWKPPTLDAHPSHADPGHGAADPVDTLQRDNRSRGAEPDWRTAGARWKRLEDIPDDVLFRVWEALG